MADCIISEEKNVWESQPKIPNSNDDNNLFPSIDVINSNNKITQKRKRHTDSDDSSKNEKQKRKSAKILSSSSDESDDEVLTKISDESDDEVLAKISDESDDEVLVKKIKVKSRNGSNAINSDESDISDEDLDLSEEESNLSEEESCKTSNSAVVAGKIKKAKHKSGKNRNKTLRRAARISDASSEETLSESNSLNHGSTKTMPHRLNKKAKKYSAKVGDETSDDASSESDHCSTKTKTNCVHKNELVTKKEKSPDLKNKDGLNTSDSEPTAVVKTSDADKSRKTKTLKVSPLNADSDSSSEGEMEIQSSSDKHAKDKKKLEEDSRHLQRLKKIQRASGIFVRYAQVFNDCPMDKKKIRKLKQILEDAGMKGQPSMKKAEEMKLKKEAEELDTDNIICGQGRSRRQVSSSLSKKVPVSDVTPIKKKFSRLKDIIDSEDSSD